MDRTIVYPGSVPLDSDVLNVNRNVMVALGALMQATLGSVPVADGLTVVPTIPASLGVAVGAGCITQFVPIDSVGYGTLAADPGDWTVKMGINNFTSTLSLVAPSAYGHSITWLVQARFFETDAVPAVLPYFNAANPAQPFMGQANGGVAQPTQRTQRVDLMVKPGGEAITGTQPSPVVDAGWVALAFVTVAAGQTQVMAGDIVAAADTPVIPFKLPQIRPGFSSVQGFLTDGVFVVPPGVTRVKATVIGGGGAGGTHSDLPSGGGGAGGQAMKIIAGLVPGSSIAVTVGAAGLVNASPGTGGFGGASSFGAYVSASGGSGGLGGTDPVVSAGGAGGVGIGGNINSNGAWGTDAISMAGRGGDGGGAGSGRATTGPVPGKDATGYGGGGGGGGTPPGGGSAAVGGQGGPGLVIVEY